MNLSIIIPLYNEENTISLVLDKLIALPFPPFINSVEIIIVDDCSTDSSNSVVAEYIKEKNFQIKLLSNPVNKGKGYVVRTGIKVASGDLIIIQDADLELDPNDIPKMLNALYELNVDFVNGSRYLPGIVRPLPSFSRYMGNRLFTLLTSFLINVKISDVACGYKLFKKDLLNKITLKENGFGFEAELIIKAMRINPTKVCEVPVQYIPRDMDTGKKLKNRHAFGIFWVILKYGLFRVK
jgi:glycosyltransferase involved in cell wall biosynthesis